MSQYPYSYPSAPTNPTAYAAAAQQQQRAGPIIVGATTSTTSAATATTTTATAANANNNNSNSTNKAHPEGRYANESLSILGSYAFSSEKNGNKRRADCMNVLERLVPPLFLCANNSINDDWQDREGESGKISKRRKGDVDSGEQDASADDTDQSDTEKGTTSSKIDFHKQLQKELKQYKQQNQDLMQRRNNVSKSLVALHELYETGLDTISRMNDLRFVPDNVMPDKIPVELK